MKRKAHGRRQLFKRRCHVFREGEAAGRIYQLVCGRVMLYKLLPDGRRQVVEVIAAGGVFGVTCLPIYDCSAETLVGEQIRIGVTVLAPNYFTSPPQFLS